MKRTWRSLAAVCALVIGVYACMAQSGVLELVSLSAADTYYNLLVQGFRAGQLSLKKDVPPGFARLADPYDPAANALYWSKPYRMLDLSYYKGRLYLYFGITPALILFWPYVALTGHYLLHSQAVAIFCAIGFLASMGLLCGLWRRYFSDASVSVMVACALVLGLATGMPVLLSQADVYEVPISCGYMLTMLALGGIWCALHSFRGVRARSEPERRVRWLAAASAAYGLAVGARPSLLFGAVILLVPVAEAWRERLVASARHERRQFWTLLVAAVGPLMLIGLGLMLYNNLRFDSPFEFGQHYQVAGQRQVTQQNFSVRYLWFNFRVYFLEPARWSRRFPFVQGIPVPPVPAGYTQVRNPFGILTNIPAVWLALAAPLAWRNRSGSQPRVLRSFVTAVALVFGICALTLGLFCGSNFRYEVDFLPALVLLAVVGMLGLDRALADRPAWRRAASCGWGLLVSFSVAFNLLASGGYYAEAHYNLGCELFQAGNVPEAVVHYEQALRIRPEYAEAHNNLAVALFQLDRRTEAMEHWDEALRIQPGYAEAHNNLGIALEQAGRLPDAVEHYEQALRTKPDYVEAHYNLGGALMQLGRRSEAMEHWEQVLRINPDYAKAHYNLAIALEQAGRLQEAIAHYQQALRIRPDFVDARNALTRLHTRQ